MKILIVDDGKTTRKILKLFLKELGFKECFVAGDGVTALSLLEEAKKKDDPFELILLDVNMPRMNGLELLAALKEHPLLKNIPVIMQTTEKQSGTILKAADLGASNYIVKPVTKEKLIEKCLPFLKGKDA